MIQNKIKSYNVIMRETTLEYLNSIASRVSRPEPEEIEVELLSIIKGAIKDENKLLPRGETLPIPKTLGNAIIAEILIKLCNVKCIMFTDSEDDKNCNVAIYCTEGQNKGIYIFDDSVLYQLTKRFNFSIGSKDFNEIKTMLFNQAPKCRQNNNRDLIAVNNGIFNYKTKELLPFSPDYVFTSKARVDYNPNAKNIIIHNDMDNTDWDVVNWINSLSDDSQIVKLLWQIIGAVIRPNVSWNHLVCLFSTFGNNGKGTLCQLLRNICGENNSAAIPLEKFSQEFMLEPLMHVSSVITDENSTKSFLKESDSLKAAITGDKLYVNRKFKDPITLKIKGLIVQCINALPKFSDKSESLYRRLLIIPFDKCFTGRERKYIKDDYIKRKEVLEYVLLEVLNSNYYDFEIPQACENILTELKNNNDPVRDFLDEFLDKYVWDLVPYKFLYDHFMVWYKHTNPSGSQIGRNSFIGEVKTLLSDSQKWIPKINAIPPGNKMKEPEPLIAEYNLTRWMNKYYTVGNDLNLKCTFIPPSSISYKGILRAKSSNAGFQAVS